MVISFDVKQDSNNIYQVVLSSGEDAFFATEDVVAILGLNVEVVEIDLERIHGNDATNMRTLTLIAQGIAKVFRQNKKVVLYYYCDDLSELPSTGTKSIWPQEYRSRIFSLMFDRYKRKHVELQVEDYAIVINEDSRPLYMHLIARKEHQKYVEILKDYVLKNYGK